MSKKIIGHVTLFYKKSKSFLFRKILIILTCFSCAFAPIFGSLVEVDALVGVDDALLATGIVSLLSLGGITLSLADSGLLTSACSDVYDFFATNTQKLGENAQKNMTMLLEGVKTAGSVSLDLWNSLTTELGGLFNDLWGSSSFNPNIDLSLGSINGHVVKQIEGADYHYNGMLAVVKQVVNGEVVGSVYTTYASYIKMFYTFDHDSIFISKASGSNTLALKPAAELWLYGKVVISFDGVESWFDKATNSWLNLDGSLQLDPPWVDKSAKTYPADLIDNSYINYGDIEDVALPRYVSKDATFTQDGTLDKAGDYVIDNTYNPTIPDYKPIPIPLPLPNVGTIPGSTTGDITGDTVIEDTTDADVDAPDYVPPTVGDFANTNIPGKLNWKEYFPFCIPFDLISFLGVLCEDPQAPHFTWNYNFAGNTGNLDVDLSRFDTLATVCRTLFDLLFIVGLAVTTRKRIGA